MQRTGKENIVETWILAALAVYLLNVFLPALMYLPQIGIAGHVGARDSLPEHARLAARARKSHANYQENLPVFLALAFLVMLSETADMGQAVLGAQLFVLGRLAYMPLYIAGIPWLRSGAYLVSFAGYALLVMAIL